LLGGLSALGCQDDKSASGYKLGDAQGGAVAGGGVTTGAGGGGGSGAGGGADSGTLAGNLALLSDSTFTMVNTFSGAMKISTDTTKGPVTVDAGGMMAPTYSIPDVKGPLAWVQTTDPTGTYVGALTRVFIPNTAYQATLVDPAIMQQIFSTLGVSGSFNAKQTHMLIKLERNKVALSGVTVTGSPGGVVAYDVGPGEFDATVQSTGNEGEVLILNTTIGTSFTTIHVVDAQQKSFDLELKVAPATISVVGFALD
jgi:hypothetical protein